MMQLKDLSIFLFTIILFVVLIKESEAEGSLLDAYFKHQAAKNSISSQRLLQTNGRNSPHNNNDNHHNGGLVDAREPGTFLKHKPPPSAASGKLKDQKIAHHQHDFHAVRVLRKMKRFQQVSRN